MTRTDAVRRALRDPVAEAGGAKLGLFRQLIRFTLIGGVCGVIDLSTYIALLGVGLPNWGARTVALLLGSSASYVANRKLTFAEANTGNTKVKAGGFVLVYLVTYFVNIGANQSLFVVVPVFAVAYGAQLKWILCWAGGQALSTGINFVMLKWVVFRD